MRDKLLKTTLATKKAPDVQKVPAEPTVPNTPGDDQEDNEEEDAEEEDGEEEEHFGDDY